MVKLLIKLIGRLIGRKIEDGSPLGAFIGAIVGAIIALLSAYAMSRADMVGMFGDGIYIILGVPGSIVGALLGAWLGPMPHVAEGTRSVRITNYSRVLKPFVIAALLGGLAVLMIEIPSGGKSVGSPRERHALAAIVLVAFISIAFLVANREPLYVAVGDQIVTIRTLLSSRLYELRQIQTWGFEVARGKFVQQPFNGVTHLLLQFDDGQRVLIQTPGGYSAAVVEILKASQPTEGRPT